MVHVIISFYDTWIMWSKYKATSPAGLKREVQKDPCLGGGGAFYEQSVCVLL